MASEQPVSGAQYCWDHEDCPRNDCGGELQQQDRFNVLCLACKGVWTHVKTETTHSLQTAAFETVATKHIARTDSGTVTAQPSHSAESPASPEVNDDGE